MRDRELILDAVALSALLDPRKPDHLYAQKVLMAWAFESAEEPDRPVVSPFVVPTVALYEVRRGLLKTHSKRLLRDLDRFLRTYA